MLKFPFFAFVAAATLGTAGASFASERAAVEPGMPSFVRELGTAGIATVGGTVAEIRPDRHFLLADAEGGTLTVDAERLVLDELAAGQAITVTGRLDEGELEAGHAIREDGSVAAARPMGKEDED